MADNYLARLDELRCTQRFLKVQLTNVTKQIENLEREISRKEARKWSASRDQSGYNGVEQRRCDT